MRTVDRAVARFGVDAVRERLASSAKSVEDVASVTGVPPEAIAKSLVVLIDGAPGLALVFGHRRLSLERLGAAAHATTVDFAPAKQVQKLTGYAPGEMAPLDVAWATSIWIDASRPAGPWLIAGAGERGTILRVRAERLYQELGGRVAEISDAHSDIV